MWSAPAGAKYLNFRPQRTCPALQFTGRSSDLDNNNFLTRHAERFERVKLQLSIIEFLSVALFILASATGLYAQQLEPRAYSISPTGVNVTNLSYGYSTGDLSFDPSLPIENASAQIHGGAAGYFRSIDVAGRSANVAIVVPYVAGNLQGDVQGTFTEAYRSGLADSYSRFSINLYGARAMNLKEFSGYHQRTNIGVSVVVSAPTGQYDPARAISIGTNRWSFKPEVGLTHAFRKTRLMLDAYAGAWIYTTNNDYQGGTRSQEPIYNSQFHLSYDVKPRFWLAFDVNFYRGGLTTRNGVAGNDLQRNSRIGTTASVPITRRQSIKTSFSAGAVTRIGGNFKTVSLGYQYLWGGGL